MVVDRAGNTFRLSKNLGSPSRAVALRDLVGNRDRLDFYRFRLTRSSAVKISLTQLGANADLTLFNNRGRVLVRSTRNGRRSELIQQTLVAGVYYTRVTPRTPQDNTRYVLTVAPSPVISPPAIPGTNPPTNPTPTPTPNPTPSPTPSPSPTPAPAFNLQFDYRFDTRGWFTPERRQALEAAATVWENLIRDEFADTPSGTVVRRFRNPETGANVDNFANEGVIDDVLIFVGARELGGSAGATLALSGPALVTSGSPRYGSTDFEPWIGTMAFDLTTNWFFDGTPNTSSDIPGDRIDFLSVAVHEIGHVLGFGTSDAFDVKVSGFNFAGILSRTLTGGSGIPLASDRGHVEQDYQLSGSGEAIMAPRFARGERRLPNRLDLTILDDIGYTINYGGVSQNPIRNSGGQPVFARLTPAAQSRLTPRTSSAQTQGRLPLWGTAKLSQPGSAIDDSATYSYCGCIGCMMF